MQKKEWQMLVKYDQKIVYGRIIRYLNKKGYGYLQTKDGEQIHLTSYNFLPGQEKHAVVGSICSFTLVNFNDKVSAENISVIDKFPNGELICVANKLISVKRITQIGLRDVRTIIKSKYPQITDEELVKYPDWNYKALFIAVKGGDDYFFFNKDSIIHGDGQCDINEKYEELYEQLLKMKDIEDYLSNDTKPKGLLMPKQGKIISRTSYSFFTREEDKREIC